jgi:Terminase small subunit
MAVLECSKHEQFALFVAKGLSATKAYVSAGYSPKGAQQSAARMLTNAKVRSRVRELQETLSGSTIALEISSRNARVQALQRRWDYLRASLDLILNQRGRRYGRSARWRQRDTAPGLQGPESRSAGDPHRPRSSLAVRRTPRPRAPDGVDPRKAVGCQSVGEQINVPRQRTLP